MEQQQRIFDFKEQVQQEKLTRKPLQLLYEAIGNGWIPEERLAKQVTGIDGYSVISNKMISFEEKIHFKNYAFNTELFLELEHYYNDDVYKGPGWSLKDIQAKCFLEFCVETREYFIYKTKPLFEQVREYNKNNTWPKGSYYPAKVLNKNMYTINIKLPRSYVKDCLIDYGTIGLTEINSSMLQVK